MPTLLLLLAVATIFLGCTEEAPPAAHLAIAPGARLEVFAVTSPDDPAATEALDPDSGRPLFLQGPPIISTDDVATVSLPKSPARATDAQVAEYREPAILVKLTPAGAAKMAAATANPSGDQVAIVVNGKVSTPKIHRQLRDSFQFTGSDDVTSTFDKLTSR